MKDTDLFAQQEHNIQRSRWLVAGFVLFFAWVGFGGDIAFGLMTLESPPGAYRHTIPILGLITTAVSGGICWYAWARGPERVLWATGAWEIIEPANEEQQRLVNVVEEMAIAAGLPRPRVHIVMDDDPNAFATGRDPQTASIAVTTGLLETLTRDELQGVVAHEMAHIRNYDTRLMTLLAAMVGAILLMSDGMKRVMRGTGRGFGGSASRRLGGAGRGGGKGGAGALGLVVLVLWLLTLVVAPIISRVLAMAVSRRREYLADATAAQLTRNPMGLAAALGKLHGAHGATHRIASGAAHLCIVDPLERKLSDNEGVLGDLFASHPPMRQRIARLEAMGYQQLKREGKFPEAVAEA
jgi:heat shock protein HtpX